MNATEGKVREIQYIQDIAYQEFLRTVTKEV